jgi:inhibitor of cysteine peptidase
MIGKMFKSVSLLIVFMALGRCNINGEIFTLSQENTGQEFEISLDTEIVLSLKSNPSTGYNWFISQIDTSILKQVGEAEYKSESKKMGAPGVQIFHFQSISIGKTSLMLIYHRPWEKEIAPLDTFQVRLTIKD